MYKYHPIPFTPIKYLKTKGKERTYTLIWIVLCLFVIPSGLITRIFELTGIPFSVFGIDFHITIYFPMLVCIPLSLCFGYSWAAIPAYFSTFFVALIGNMPLHWILVFSFANPIGLAMLVMIYRITPARLDLKTTPAMLFFVIVSFLSALSGSIGSFIWTYTNQVNLHDFFKVWQGWWLGGFLQSIFICAPFLYLFSSKLLRIRDQLTTTTEDSVNNRGRIKVAVIIVITVIILYIWLAFQINILNIEDKLKLVIQEDIRNEILKATRVINFPVSVFIFIIMFIGYFFFYFTDYWNFRLQNLNDQLTESNNKLTDKNENMYHNSIHDNLTGIFNRAYLFKELEEQFLNAKKNTIPLTFLMLDLDKFKKINDTYGHQTGDVVLKLFTQMVLSLINKEMTFARFGGEEFCLIIPNQNGSSGEVIAKNIIESTRELNIEYLGNVISISVSIGVREVSDSDENIDHVIEMADKALYQAKNNGRDQFHRSL
jgi:diguanylate cyclase (GGDEF)-like protein